MAAMVACMLGIGAVASLLGVCTRTLRRWDAAGTFRPDFRTAGNHRRYDRRRVLVLLSRRGPGNARGEKGAGRGREVVRAAIYSRVSSSKQKVSGDLGRQQDALLEHCEGRGYRVTGKYSDVGSGLNDGRRGLLKLLRDVARGRHDVVVASYQDRLSRFGIGVIEEHLASWGVALEIVHPVVVDDTPHGGLITDLTAILYSFMGRLYRMRRGGKAGGG